MADLTDLELKKDRIRKQHCFASLNDAENDVLASLLVEKTFSPGSVIVKQGDHVDSVYIIVAGTANVIRSHIENHQTIEEVVATLKEGDAIGLSQEGFYSLTGMRTATVVATSEMLALKLSVAIFRGFALAYPRANEVMRKQAERL